MRTYIRNPQITKLIGLAVVLISSSMQIACSDQSDDHVSSETFKSQDKEDTTSGHSEQVSFSLLTQLGETLLENSRVWEERQLDERDEYAQPRMCAHNVSRVLEMSGLHGYSSYLVPEMTDAVVARGGWVTMLDSRSEEAMVRSLNEILDGHLPVGTLLNGCLYEDCSGEGGDGHIAIVGHTDSDGVVWAYHNNWYRPDNEGGTRRPHMVSKEYYDEYGLRRQWMATPWIQIRRDEESGLIKSVKGLLPEIDDLDPFTGFYITVSIIPEILRELDALRVDHLYCPVGLTPDPILFACVDGESPEANVYSMPSQKMIKDCTERGYGRACTDTFELHTEGGSLFYSRWARGVYEDLRGPYACPIGLRLDYELDRCIESAEHSVSGEVEVYGPFARELVDRCSRSVGVEQCRHNRWPLSLYKELMMER